MAAVLAAPQAAAAAQRFWGSLVAALGKPAYSSETVKRGRRVVGRSRHALGVERSVRIEHGIRVKTEKFEVARWEVVPALLLGGAALALTAEGSARIAGVKGKYAGSYTNYRDEILSKIPLFGKAYAPGGAGAPGGQSKNALGISFGNSYPGGGANPLNYL
jgi:hypothetical protein